MRNRDFIGFKSTVRFLAIAALSVGVIAPSWGGSPTKLDLLGQRPAPAEPVDAPTLPAPPQDSIAQVWNEELLDAIRLDTPRPTVHARNLYHLSVAMWDAWAAYDKDAVGILTQEKVPLALATPEARAETISYAAYRVLKYRFQIGPGAEITQPALDDRMAALGYDPNFRRARGPMPAALGNKIARRVLQNGNSDGSNESNDYEDYTGYFAYNPPMVIEFPGTLMFFPNRWQPLAFEHLVLQNGIIVGQAIQEFIGPFWGRVTPWAMTEDDMSPAWVYMDPGAPPQLGGADDQEFKEAVLHVLRASASLDPSEGQWMDIGPAGIHNNTLGTHDGTGYEINPVTREPYEANMALLGDYGRVLAEYWADGPESETPPGHWNVIANDVAENPLLRKRLGGSGPEMDDLEWDVKVYLALNGAMHDAAIAAWGAKGFYDYSRPVSHIRHMSGKGQSSDPTRPSFHPEGMLLEPGLVELITEDSIQPGERHEGLGGENNENIDKIAVRCWQGAPEDNENEYGGVGWILGEAWLPYQRDTFVTPAFAGYVSGHSTFSRAGAEVMTAMTGTEYFPGGLASAEFPAGNFLQFEDGPENTVHLQWATYYDAADEAGISRIYGGIHVPADDFPGRIMGSQIGQRSFRHALQFFGSGEKGRPGMPTGDLPQTGGLTEFGRP